MRSQKPHAMGFVCKRLALTFLIILLTACTGKWSTTPTPRASDVQVQHVQRDHIVTFDDDLKDLSPSEQTALHSFLMTLPSEVHLQLFGTNDSLLSAVSSNIHRELSQGVQIVSQRYHAGDPQELPETAVRISASGWVAVFPGCPAFDALVKPEELGCINNRMLALMVADPGHLAEPVRLRPADGARSASRVQAYREGEVAELKEASFQQ